MPHREKIRPTGRFGFQKVAFGIAAEIAAVLGLMLLGALLCVLAGSAN